MPTNVRYSFAGTAQEHSSTMSQVASSQPRQIEKLYESFDYMEFPMTNLIDDDDEAAYVVAQEFTDERYPPMTDPLAEALDASETDVDVTSGLKFQVYQLIRIDDEIMWITSFASANTVNVIRGGSIGSTAATHASGATIYILSTATPENVAAVASVTARGDTVTNYCQIFQHAIKVSDRQNNAGSYLIGANKNPNAPSKEYSWEMARQFEMLARERELTIWHGVPFAGSTSLPSTMGGIPAFITTNVTDLNGAPFTPMQIMDAAQATWVQGGPTNMARTIIAGATARRALSSFYKVNVQLRTTDKRVSFVVDEIETDLGTFELADANYWIPEALVVGIDPDNYKWRKWAGYGGVHESKLAIDGSYQKGAVTADMTLICGGNRVSWKFVEAATLATDYPSLQG